MMYAVPPDAADLRDRAGLCGSCTHAIVRPTNRGTVYLRCGLAATDSRFPRYPRLPVLRCEGHQLPTGAVQRDWS
jgi:hypothetical protein